MKPLISFILAVILSYPVIGYGFDNKRTHRTITEFSLPSSTLIHSILEEQLGFSDNWVSSLKNGQKEQMIFEWFQDGSLEEDEPACRAANHFHNPLSNSWENAELTDNANWIDLWCETKYPMYAKKYSTVVWATNMIDKEQNHHGNPFINYVFLPDVDDVYGRNWSVARELYHWALKTEDKPNRDIRLAETFRTIGYVLHLLQDMAVPAHTRNDFSKGHTQPIGCPVGGDCTFTNWLGNPFEDYVRDNLQTEILPEIGSDISFPYKGEKRLTNFWDTDTITQTNNTPQIGFDIGLSEYSNSNFFSHNTIFKEESDTLHYFPYPNKDSITVPDVPDQANLKIHEITAKDSFIDRVLFVDKDKHGEKIDRFLASRYMITGYKDNSTDVLSLELAYYLNNQCFLEYAKKIIPRAIGYSASLLDYFFRGKINIQHAIPHYGPDLSINSIDFSMKNITPPIMENQSVEPMSSGFFELITSYKDTDGTIVRNLVPTTIYTVTGETDPINSEFVSIQIPLVNTIPIEAKDLSFTVIFKGKLGYEEGAVAAQVYKFENAGRLAYYNQPNGPQNTSNIFTISPDRSYPYQVTDMSNPNPWYFAPVWSRDGSQLAFEESGCLDEGFDPFNLEAGCPADYSYRKILIVDTESDLPFPDNILLWLDHNGAAVANPTFSPDGTKVAALLRNEAGFYYYGNIVAFNLSDGTSQLITNYGADRTSLGNSRPAWSPAGDSIAYYVHRGYDDTSNSWESVGDIFLVDPEDGAETRLTNDDFLNLQPAWSPDGDLIAFSSDRDSGGSMDIWLMYKDGTNLFQLYDSPADCYNPAFSPDGRKVAFSNGSAIYTIDIDGDPASLKEVAVPGLLTGGLSWSSYLAPPSLEVQSTPLTVTPSQPATISWQSEGATEVYIEGIPDIQPPDGDLTVFPQSTTTYTLTAVGVKGAKESTITVTVE